MLRYKEKEDVEARYSQVEQAVDVWRSMMPSVPPDVRDEYRARLRISLIYHDAALEGEVLSHSEINAAVDPTIISDASLIPAYEEVKHLNVACDYAEEHQGLRKKPIRMETIKEIADKLEPDEKLGGAQFRKDNPLHRLYYHEIAPPEKILYRMRKLGEWLDERGTQAMHPIERSAKTHFKLMQIFPWAKLSGRCARVLSNLMLCQADYPVAVIHSTDRQRYYEALRQDNNDLVLLYLEAVETSAVSEVRVYEEAMKNRRIRRRA